MKLGHLDAHAAAEIVGLVAQAVGDRIFVDIADEIGDAVAKARIVGMSAFTGQKKSLISPVDSRVEVPMIDKRTGQIISISGNLVQMMDMESYSTFESPMPDDAELRGSLAAGVEVEYWDVLGRRMIVRRKG